MSEFFLAATQLTCYSSSLCEQQMLTFSYPLIHYQTCGKMLSYVRKQQKVKGPRTANKVNTHKHTHTHTHTHLVFALSIVRSQTVNYHTPSKHSQHAHTHTQTHTNTDGLRVCRRYTCANTNMSRME
jgi:hypothetical protein